jgi:hypothetical protein
MEPSVISNPHKYPLFLFIEDSGVELWDDLLIPVVPKLEQISDTMQVTSLKNPVKVHVLLVPHIPNIHILLLDHWRWLRIKHSLIPILMKEGLDSLISAPLLDQVVASLVVEMQHIQGILLAVVHNFLCGVNLRRIHLEALRIIRSTTMRWRDLGGRLLLVVVGSWSLGKLLGLGRMTTRESTDILMMLRVTFITTRHCLQERISNMSQYKAWELKKQGVKPLWGTHKKSTINGVNGPGRSDISGPRTGYVRLGPAIGQICSVRIDPLGKMSINNILLVENLSNLTQEYSSTLGTTYSRIVTCIVRYESRSQKLEIEI